MKERPEDVKKDWEFEILEEGEENILFIYVESIPTIPSIEDDEIVMGKTVEILTQLDKVTKIIFTQKRDYEYDFGQTQMLVELANVYKRFNKDKAIFGYSTTHLLPAEIRKINQQYTTIQNLIYKELKGDPIGTFVEIKRIARSERIELDKATDIREQTLRQRYIALLNYLLLQIEKLKIIQVVTPELAGYQKGDREVYRILFSPTIKPDFMFTKLMADYPAEGEEKESYTIGEETEVTVFTYPSSIETLYHIIPPEFKLSEEKYELLDTARKIMAEHKPRQEEFTDPKRMRQVFFNIGRDLIEELAQSKGIRLKQAELDALTNILVRYTVGFGLIEVLLQDEKIQDISVNSPMGKQPIFIVHGDYNECTTNIIPTNAEAESWATKLRMISGRPLDEADPILDTELELPGASTRVSVITKPLDPTGLAFSFRRHRENPWTLPLFVKQKMLTAEAAGLLSFLIDGTRTLLVCGTRSSGKTSLLGALMVEIMRKYRVLTIEDTLELPGKSLRELGFNIQQIKVAAALAKESTEMSAADGIRSTLRLGDSALIVGEVRSSVRGDEEVFIVDKGKPERIAIKELEKRDISEIYVPTMDRDLTFKLKKLVAFVKHPKREKLLEVVTKTGRRITVTPDHSLFTSKEFRILPIECKDLQINDKIIIPEKIPSGYNNIEKINIFELLEGEDCRVEGYEEDLRKIIQKIGWKNASAIANRSNDIYQYLRTGIQHTNIPISIINQLTKEANYSLNTQTLQIKKGTSKTVQAEIEVSKDLCRFLGYYVAEGYTQKETSVVVLSNGNQKIVEDITSLAKKLFNVDAYIRKTEGLGISTQITLSNKILGLVLKKLGCGRVSTEKRVPAFIFGLCEEKICEFLKGYFDGDGCQVVSERSGNSISCATVSKGLADDIMHLLLCLGIVGRVEKREVSAIGKHKAYIVIFKQRKYVQKFLKKIGFKKYNKESIEKDEPHSKFNTIHYDPKKLEEHVKLKRKYRHLRRNNSCGKDYLKKVVDDAEWASKRIKTFVNGEFYVDEIKEIKELILEEKEYVYDLSVEPCQNFIGGFGGIMLHNTEAIALYEAMRIGAAANVVAGTIHSDSPYGVYDRVVNDIGVPKTSFKATDVIIVANPIKSADGLHKNRRVTQITEVRKQWENDPLTENGFMDLMKYNAKTDMLEATDAVTNGESEVLKTIAANIKEFAGNWDAVRENIELRGKIKAAIVDYSTKLNNPNMLEAPFVIKANDKFHLLSEAIKEDVGYLDPKRIFYEWDEWIKREAKRI